MFINLKAINARPIPFHRYTARELWTNDHTAKKMLAYHLNAEVDAASRTHGFIERSVEWIVSRFGVDETTEIADFGCGPGLYTTPLAEAGAVVTGIDFSANSLDYAKQKAVEKGLEIDYVLENYIGYETSRRFDLILMIMCDFCVLSPDQRRVLLSKFHSLLKPQGAILLDVYSLNAFKRKEEIATYEMNQMDGFWSPDDHYVFLNSFKYKKEKVSLDKYTIIEPCRTREVYNWLQYFSKVSLRREFEENGLEVQALFADLAGTALDSSSTEYAVVAKKMTD